MQKIKRFFEIAKGGYQIFWILKKEKDFKKSGPKINSVLSGLGPTFIKLGQMLSLRADLIPAELADEMRKLLDNGKLVPYVSIKKIFQEEFNKPPKKLFESFEEKPFAVASLAQVHKAKYKKKTVAVKVQKPGIEKIVQSDLRLAKTALGFLRLIPGCKKAVSLVNGAISEYFNWIDHELDYRLEAINIARISQNFSKVSYFHSPEVITALSSKKILTMEYIEGVSLNELFDNVKDLSKKTTCYKNITLRKDLFVKRVIHIVFKQIFEDGYFHADPHPANVIVTPDEKISYIDFGVVGVFGGPFRKTVFDMFLGVMDHDIPKIAKSLISLDEIEGHANIEVIEKKIRALLNEWQTGNVLEITLAEVFFRLIIIALSSGIDLPKTFVVIGKTILEYDGDLRRFDPELDLVSAFRPHVEKAYSAYGFGAPEIKIPTTIDELIENLEFLPAQFHSMVKNLSKDGVELTVRFSPVRIKPEYRHAL